MRKFKIFSIIIILSLIMFQFQNCSPPPEGYTGEVEDSTAGLVDDLPNTKLSFVESIVISKHDKDIINYDGLCSQDSDGLDVEWVLEEVSSREVVLDGKTQCERGGFRITITEMLSLECNKDYELIPYIGEFEDRVIVRRKCDPISSVAIDDTRLQSAKYNPNIATKTCFYELDKSTSSKNNCSKVCYMSNKLYTNENVEANFCAQ